MNTWIKPCSKMKLWDHLALLVNSFKSFRKKCKLFLHKLLQKTEIIFHSFYKISIILISNLTSMRMENYRPAYLRNIDAKILRRIYLWTQFFSKKDNEIWPSGVSCMNRLVWKPTKINHCGISMPRMKTEVNSQRNRTMYQRYDVWEPRDWKCLKKQHGVHCSLPLHCTDQA